MLDVLCDATAKCLARWEGQQRAPHLLAAVSGGADSTALALVLATLRNERRLAGDVIVAHVDHGFPPECKFHAARVEALAARLGLPFEVRALGLGPEASEARMRDDRYAALAQLARERDAGMILTAHHADDDVETILFRMMRGTGVRGLSGIPECRPLDSTLLLVRPLLRNRRDTLARVVRAAGERWVEDPLNRDLSKSRNQLRHEIVPQLRERLGTRLDSSLFAIARTARDVTAMLDAGANRILGDASTRVGDWRVEIALDRLDEDTVPFVEAALRVIHERLTGETPKRAWLRRAVDLQEAPTGARLAAGGGLLIERARHRLIIVHTGRSGTPPSQPVELIGRDGSIPERPAFGDTEWELHAELHDEPPLSPPPSQTGPTRAVLDLRAGPLPWRVRPQRAGDRLRPLGAPGSTSVRKLMQARGVSTFDRSRLPLLVDADDRVLWVAGVELADRARVTLQTTLCAELSLAR